MSTDTPDSVTIADRTAAWVRGVAVWLGVGMALLALWGSVLAGEVSALGFAVSLLVSVALLALGVGLTPGLTRRLARRRSIMRFGRDRTVEHRLRRPGEGERFTCVECGTRADAGVVRRYREEQFVAGVPVAVLEEGRNRYCRLCATGERSTPDPGPDEDGNRRAEPETEPATE